MNRKGCELSWQFCFMVENYTWAQLSSPRKSVNACLPDLLYLYFIPRCILSLSSPTQQKFRKELVKTFIIVRIISTKKGVISIHYHSLMIGWLEKALSSFLERNSTKRLAPTFSKMLNLLTFIFSDYESHLPYSSSLPPKIMNYASAWKRLTACLSMPLSIHV